jgi:hypothetical protein
MCQLDTFEIEYLKTLINSIPSFPEGFVTDWQLVKANSNKT